jgi:membrane protein YdbS with pleckstrin-like domain
MAMAESPAHDTINAKFNPLIRPYLVFSIGLPLVLTIVLIPLALIWFCGVGQWWARHYYDKLKCELSATELRFQRGILFQVEKTIPLENIQDVTFIEGPLLKRFHLSVLKFETAGQSDSQAHDMRFVGIIDAQAFRAEILKRREAAKHGYQIQARLPAQAVSDEHTLLLKSIQAQLGEIITLMREKR